MEEKNFLLKQAFQAKYTWQQQEAALIFQLNVSCPQEHKILYFPLLVLQKQNPRPLLYRALMPLLGLALRHCILLVL